jgi:hypothetical protein
MISPRPVRSIRDNRQTMCALKNQLHLAQHLAELLRLTLHVSSHAMQDQSNGSVLYLCRACGTFKLRNLVLGLLGQVDGIGPCLGSSEEKGGHDECTMPLANSKMPGFPLSLVRWDMRRDVKRRDVRLDAQPGPVAAAVPFQLPMYYMYIERKDWCSQSEQSTGRTHRRLELQNKRWCTVS